MHFGNTLYIYIYVYIRLALLVTVNIFEKCALVIMLKTITRKKMAHNKGVGIFV